jgi:hypothetical protein
MRARLAVGYPLGVGVVATAIGCTGIARSSAHALFAYAAAFFVVATTGLGALLFVMVAHTARARWFVIMRRITAAVASTLLLMPVLFLPIAFGLRTLYPWARPLEALEDDALRHQVEHARPWMNAPLFLVRSYVYLLAWASLAHLLRRTSLANDDRPSEEAVRRERLVSAAGLPVIAVTLTMAAFDWIMPLSPRWASDVFGFYLFAGSLGASIGATAVALWLAWRSDLLPREVRPDHFHALGRVLLVGVIFWTYIAFCQFLLTWIADLPREVIFYGDRVRGPWRAASKLLAIVHFVIPFAALLSRPLKRTPAALAVVGLWMIAAHALDLYWLCVPPAHDGMRWSDLGWLVGLPCVCAAFATWRYLGAAPFPTHDPALGEALRYESP